MVRTYSVIRPVIGFSRDDKRIVTIPAGALIRLVVVPGGVGITATVFEGRAILLQYEDIERNGVNVEIGTVGVVTHQPHNSSPSK